eukprot:NODE_3_length_80033_cov_0.932970.p50 type:complete len:195 gc:universal NODE_3_length_80033_cov_0.932970:23499-22915(-)
MVICFKSKLFGTSRIISLFHKLPSNAMQQEHEEADATNLEFGEFNGGYCLMLGEVYNLLFAQKIERISQLQSGNASTPGYSTPGSNLTGPTNASTYMQLNDMSDEDLTRTLPKSFLSSFEHVSKFAKISNLDNLDQIRHQCEMYNLHRFETCQLGSLVVEDSDEAKSLIPSIKLDDSDLRRLLSELRTMKAFIQ